MQFSKQTRYEWFPSKIIKLLQWPACIPYCNPIEHHWGILVRKVYSNDIQSNWILELKNALRQSWYEIGSEILQRLTDSMSKRIFRDIKNKGGQTKNKNKKISFRYILLLFCKSAQTNGHPEINFSKKEKNREIFY